MPKPKIILSTFDGISTGQYIATKLFGSGGFKYYASEVDKNAIAITSFNYPETIHLGDIRDIGRKDLPEHVDLLIGGSSCTDFSFAGQMKGMVTSENVEVTTLDQYLGLKADGFEFKGESYLFWEFMRLRWLLKPDHFMLENVRMTNKWKETISDAVGFEPIALNSNLVSAQNRYRLYWFGERVGNTYKQVEVEPPADRGILLKDVVHEFQDDLEITDRGMAYMMRVPKDGRSHWKRGHHSHTHHDKSRCVTRAFKSGLPYNVLVQDINEFVIDYDKALQIIEGDVAKGKIQFLHKTQDGKNVYFIHGKEVTLDGDDDKSDYLFGCITPARITKRQNGQRFNTGKKFYTLTRQDGHGILLEGRIRAFTPVECERLQTLPENYTKYGAFGSEVKPMTKGIRLSALGNGWTADMVEHILRVVFK